MQREFQNMVEVSVGAGPFAEHRYRRMMLAAHRGLLAATGGKP